jgi:hypothetical protein
MTNEEINIAIAEACGWTDCVLVESIKLSKGFPPPNNPPSYGTYENGMAQLPNYCNDLNAMHEAVIEIFQDASMQLDYSRTLIFVIKKLSPICKRFFSDFDLANATARQRAEAFLKTLGKWEGAK